MSASLLAALFLAQTAPATAVPTVAPPPATAPGEDVVFADLDQRMTVAVSVTGRGPFAFVVDTGAERTVVARELADSLTLAPGPTVSLLAMTGTSLVPTVTIPQIAIGTAVTGAVQAPVLIRRNMGALGILGLDVLQGKTVAIDFTRQVMTVAPAARHRSTARTTPDEIVVIGRNLFGQLVVTDAFYRGHRIRVVLDTGSMATIGNSALQQLVAGRHTPTRPVTLISVTGDTLQAAEAPATELEIGGMRLGNLPIAFADAAPFARFGLSHYPALLLGMDTMRQFRRVEIDFANRQARFLLARNAQSDGGFGLNFNGSASHLPSGQ